MTQNIISILQGLSEEGEGRIVKVLDVDDTGVAGQTYGPVDVIVLHYDCTCNNFRSGISLNIFFI